MEPGILPIGVIVGVKVGIKAVGVDSAVDNGKGEIIGSRVAVWVEIKFTGAVSFTFEAGVWYGTLVPHRSLAQDERIIPKIRNNATTLPVCEGKCFISGGLYSSTKTAK
jgi:hypothetical protein